ncbi:LysR family transcriptional regulator [Gluconacetobacter azotocaptans]|uniref:LysR family transcriptional regulator n=1 Tax=Gluconacetobacter azotocaptans TaxID=142834 RepID=A0A7W4JVP9_9PROT|nr:LysR family transcriptional regulator [Gluconacetobacter azotocaptans]MBB2191677.1 LysR family transcriptional regulator [Gluconacetobacter azotocaptans]GBQ33539.1 LysR family transcriptional regulator [Gluconacetobacter azotocaptans DSM 13594]
MRDSDEMEIFVEIVRQGGLSAAARHLGLAPSVVSERLSRLERRLGTRLLVRTTRRQTLTEAGRIYLDEAGAIMAATAEMEARVRATVSAPGGMLRVTAPMPFGRIRLAPFVAGFVRRHPDIRVHLALEDRMTDIVGEGYDIAIRAAPVVDTTLTGRRLMESRRVLVASPDYLARHGRPHTPADLARHACLVANMTGQCRGEWRFGRGKDIRILRVDGVLASSNSELPVHWALDGLGLTQKSLWEVEDHLHAGRLETVMEAWEPDPVTFYAIHTVSTAQSHKIALFMGELLQPGGIDLAPPC